MSMKSWLSAPLGALALFALLCQTAPVRAEEKADAPDPIAELALANALVKYAFENESPESLVVAVRIMMQHPVGELNDKGKVKLSEDQVEEMAALLNQAAKMRPADKTVAELIARTRRDMKEASRALVSGKAAEAAAMKAVRRIHTDVKAGTVKEARVAAVAGKPLVISAQGVNARVVVTSMKSRKLLGEGMGRVTVTPAEDGDVIVKVTSRDAGTLTVFTGQ